MNKYEEIKPKMKGRSFANFGKRKLNNAILLSYETYIQDLSDFESLFIKFDRDFAKFLKACKELENNKDPQAALKKMINNQSPIEK